MNSLYSPFSIKVHGRGVSTTDIQILCISIPFPFDKLYFIRGYLSRSIISMQREGKHLGVGVGGRREWEYMS